MAEQKPVIAVRTGRTEAAQRAAASHTFTAATPTVSGDALFHQAGVIPVEGLTDLLGAACLLSWQPLPLGARVAVVGNVGGIGVLAADTCAEHGLPLPVFEQRGKVSVVRRSATTDTELLRDLA
jgi:acyl-CoA synthetase (NDP forming)